MAKNNSKKQSAKQEKPQKLYKVIVCLGDWWEIEVPGANKTEVRSKVLNDNYDKSKMRWISGDYPKPSKDNRYRIEVQPWDADNKNTADGDQKKINYRQEIKFGSVEEIEE